MEVKSLFDYIELYKLLIKGQKRISVLMSAEHIMSQVRVSVQWKHLPFLFCSIFWPPLTFYKLICMHCNLRKLFQYTKLSVICCHRAQLHSMLLRDYGKKNDQFNFKKAGVYLRLNCHDQGHRSNDTIQLFIKVNEVHSPGSQDDSNGMKKWWDDVKWMVM